MFLSLTKVYDERLAELLIEVVRCASTPTSNTRFITLEMALRTLRYVCFVEAPLPAPSPPAVAKDGSPSAASESVSCF